MKKFLLLTVFIGVLTIGIAAPAFASDQIDDANAALGKALQTLRTPAEESESTSVFFPSVPNKFIRELAYPVTWGMWVYHQDATASVKGVPEDLIVSKRLGDVITKNSKYPKKKYGIGSLQLESPWSEHYMSLKYVASPMINLNGFTTSEIDLFPVQSQMTTNEWKGSQIGIVSQYASTYVNPKTNVGGGTKILTLNDLDAQFPNAMQPSPYGDTKKLFLTSASDIKQEDGTLAGLPARIYSVKWELNGDPHFSKAYYTIIGDEVLSVEMVAPVEKMADVQRAFDVVLNSIKLKTSQPSSASSSARSSSSATASKASLSRRASTSSSSTKSVSSSSSRAASASLRSSSSSTRTAPSTSSSSRKSARSSSATSSSSAKPRTR